MKSNCQLTEINSLLSKLSLCGNN